MKTAKWPTMAAIAVTVWFALGLQFYLTMAAPPPGSPATAARAANFFSYFTITTNIAVALALTLVLIWPQTAWGRFFSRDPVQTGVALYIGVVEVTYSLLLRHIWNPTGAQKLADVLLHDVVPVAFVLYWLIFVPKAGLRWKHALLWLVYPLVYMLYTLTRGVATAWWPYPFVDATVLGFPRALGNGVLVLLAFFVLGLLAVAIGRWRARYQ